MNPRVHAVPLWMAIGILIRLIAGFALLGADAEFGAFVKTLVIGAAIVLWAIGIFTAWRSAAATKLKALYTLAAAVMMIGMGSFSVLREPTTIILFGGVCMIADMMLGLGAGLLIFRAAVI